MPVGGDSVCVPDSGHNFIELVDAATNTWRIAGTVNGDTISGHSFSVYAPSGGAPVKISEIDISHQESLNNPLRINIFGSFQDKINDLGAITRRSSSNAPMTLRDVYIDGEVRGYSSGFSSSLRAPITVTRIDKLQASGSIRVDARLNEGSATGYTGIISDTGSITGYIGGAGGATTGSQPSGTLLPIVATSGSIGSSSASTNDTIINAGTAYILLRAGALNASTNYNVANGSWASIQELKINGNAKGNLRLESIGTSSVPNPGIDPPTSGWTSNPKRPAFQIGGQLDGVVVTGSSAGGGDAGIFGQVIIGSTGSSARVSLHGDIADSNPTANKLDLPHYGRSPADLGNGSVGGTVAVGDYGLLHTDCEPATNNDKTLVIPPCDFNFQVILRHYGPVKSAGTPEVIITRDDTVPGASGSVITPITPTIVTPTSTERLKREVTVGTSSTNWFAGRTYTFIPNADVSPHKLRSHWMAMDTDNLVNTPTASLSVADWQYSFQIDGCFADIGQSGGVPGSDGVLDNNDYIAFVNFYFGPDPMTDMGVAGGLPGSDGLYDNNDFISFINLSFGCTPPSCKVGDEPQPSWMDSAQWVRTGDFARDRETAALWHAFDRTGDLRVYELLIQTTFAP